MDDNSSSASSSASSVSGSAEQQDIQPWYEPIVFALTSAVKRVVLYLAFLRARQPARIKQVLSLVYASQANLDDDLITSIVNPALDPQASEVRRCCCALLYALLWNVKDVADALVPSGCWQEFRLQRLIFPSIPW